MYFPLLVVAQLDDYQLNYKASGQGGLGFSNSAGLILDSWRATGSGGLSFSGGGFIVDCGHALQYQPTFSHTPTGGLRIGSDTQSRYGLARSDFQFEGSCGHTVYDHEVESYEPITGRLTAWVSVPTDPNEVDLYLYYGGPDGSPDAQAVWEDEYSAVYHGNNYADVLGNANGTAPSFTAGNISSDHRPTPVPGIVNNALRFDGNDYFTTGNDTINTIDDFTLEAWIIPSAILARQVAISRGKTNTTNGTGWSASLGLDEAGKPWAQVQTVCDGEWTKIEVIGETSITVNQRAYISAVWRSGESLTVYLNGVEDGTTATTHQALLTGGGNQIGRRDEGLYFNGDLDELRLSRVARSADYFLSTYNNVSAPETFAIVGIQEHALHLWGCPTIKVNRSADIPTGGLTFGGTAPSNRISSGAIGAGGLTLGGGYKVGFFKLGLGSLTLAGTATTKIDRYRAAGSGGLAFSNSASLKANYKASPAGKLTLAGTSLTRSTNSVTGLGGLRLGSSASTKIKSFRVSPSGGFVLGGTSQPGRYVGGGLAFSGSANSKRSQTTVGSGGLVFGSSGSIKVIVPVGGSGGLLFGSSATTRIKSFIVAPSGGLSLAGTSQPGRYIGGGLVFSTSATAKINYKPTTQGGLRLMNSGLVMPLSRVIPAGGLRLGGNHKLGLSATGTGGLALAGSYKVGFKVIGSGGFIIGCPHA